MSAPIAVSTASAVAEACRIVDVTTARPNPAHTPAERALTLARRERIMELCRAAHTREVDAAILAPARAAFVRWRELSDVGSAVDANQAADALAEALGLDPLLLVPVGEIAPLN